MGTCITHAIPGVAVGQVIAGLPGIEGKFQHLHAGIARVLLELPDLPGEVPQVLGNELHPRQPLPQGTDEIPAGARQPVAAPGCVILCRNCPVALKAPEMVQAHHIVHPARRPQAAQPPGIAGRAQLLPVVQRVPPQLPVGGKRIRRHPCHQPGLPVLIQLEQLAV
ncbi:unknown [Firmicutes bacterium CAG:137]|nr:unknown [Firmicutes bacterium CAG:137]